MKYSLFSQNKKVVIGALHFNPLIGYSGFTNFEDVLKKAKEDLQTLENGGVNAIIIENNYNLPHRIEESEEVIKMMSILGIEISKLTKLPIGVSLLWNDFIGAFKIAKKFGAKFIRVPVFVDSVVTSFGEIIAHPQKVIEERKKQNAEDVIILADIHVKHAKMIDEKKSIFESAIEAKKYGADGIIITGRWTGDAPLIENLKEARIAIGEEFPIIVGSGASRENIASLFNFSDAVIVSTSIKEGENKSASEERNIKPYEAKISLEKTKEFMEEVRREYET